MKWQYQILHAALWAWGLSGCAGSGSHLIGNTSQNTLPGHSPSQDTNTPVPGAKTMVQIVPAEDRWIRLADGTRVYQGLEISYLLGEKLLESGKFVPVLLPDPHGSSSPQTGITAFDVGATEQQMKMQKDREKQIPLEWTGWLGKQISVLDFTPIGRIIKVTPIVETMTYTSGDRSNKVTYGFSPDHLNPFNQGRAGALDNEFIATEDQVNACERPDFFDGKFTPPGLLISQSNFGSNIDEGAVIEIAGYGIGFKQKHFDIKTQIRFIVEEAKTGLHQEYVFKTTGSGQDLFFAGAYQGISLALEIQRRQTLLDSLKKILPTIVSQLISEGLNTTAVSTLALESTSSPSEKVFENQVDIPLDNLARAAAQDAATSPCVLDKPNAWSETLKGLFSGYAVWRFFNVFDQWFNKDMPSSSPSTLQPGTLKIGVLDSGVDYNDVNLSRYILRVSDRQAEGFDFISWDWRPSDDNGHGTAALKYLITQTQVPFVIVPIKVIGAHGETHSGAIYDGFSYAVDDKVDALVVPWSARASSMGAYKMGVNWVASHGIPVFVAPQTVSGAKNIYVPAMPASQDFTDSGLGNAQVRLDPFGVATIDELAHWMNSKNLGRSL